MSSPQNVTSDEVLAALLLREGASPQAVTEEEIRTVRQRPRAISVQHSPEAATFTIDIDETTPVQQLQQMPSINDIRPVGPGTNF